MFGNLRRASSLTEKGFAATKCSFRAARRGMDDERGGTLVEFALVTPLFIILVFAMVSFGILFNQYLQLTEAVNIGGEQLSIARNNFADPCQTVAAAVTNSTVLSSANLTFSFNLAGTAYTFSKGASPSCTAGATTLSNAGAGSSVQLTVKYSCAGIRAMWSFNPLPSSSCNLQSSITELSQ